MIDKGTEISFTLSQGAEPRTGTVRACNKRGTSCNVELRPGETTTINLHKVSYSLFPSGEAGATPSGIEEAPSSSQEKSKGTDDQKKDTGQERGASGPQSKQSDVEHLQENEERSSSEENNVDAGSPDEGRRIGVLQDGKLGNTQASDSGAEDGTPGQEEGTSDGTDGNAGGRDNNGVDNELRKEVDLSEAEGVTGGLNAFDTDTQTCLDAFCSAAARLQNFQGLSGHLAGLARLATKALFDFTVAATPSADASTSGLPELYVDGFDAEQIWGQLDLASAKALRRLRKKVKKMTAEISLMDSETEAHLDELIEEFSKGGQLSAELSQSAGEEETDMAVSSEQDSEEEEGAVDRETASPIAPANTRDEGKTQRKQNRQKKTVLDDAKGEAELLPTEDQFLRLDDMEQFVQDAEEAAMRENDDAGESDDGNDDDSEGDGPDNQFGDLGAESNSDEEDAELARLLENAAQMVGRNAAKATKKNQLEEDEDAADGLMYADFFGAKGQAGRQVGEHRRRFADQVDDMPGWSGEEDVERDSEEGMSEEFDEEDSGEEGVSKGGDRAFRSPERSSRNDAAVDMSAHERRVARIAERARRLEEDNLAEKEWFMRGEAAAGARPLNSALEIDLDFERTLKPPPQPTEETTASLEDIIKRRIVDRQFDDPQRKAPPPDGLQKELLQLDDNKSAKGLGEVYEEEFVRAKTGNAMEDKDEKTRNLARVLLKSLFAKLDALSHFHFAPKPIVQDLTVRAEVPALAMKEVAPQVVSEAARQLPEEVYKAPKPGTKTEEEMTQADRKKRRAAKKRAFKKKEATKVENAGDHVNIIGRKSAAHDSSVTAAEKLAKKKKKRKQGADDDAAPRIKYTKSAAVLGHIQDMKGMKKQKVGSSDVKAANFKL